MENEPPPILPTPHPRNWHQKSHWPGNQRRLFLGKLIKAREQSYGNENPQQGTPREMTHPDLPVPSEGPAKDMELQTTFLALLFNIDSQGSSSIWGKSPTRKTNKTNTQRNLEELETTVRKKEGREEGPQGNDTLNS